MIKLFLITKDPETARKALTLGVDRIFVDLELLGKEERQGHLSTVISRHTLDDVSRLRAVVPHGQLLVRTNPVHPGITEELEAVLSHRPDFLMLPMFRSASEVERYASLVRGRAPIIPLVETPEAAAAVGEIAALPGVAEIYVGLNDLHLALKQSFMFESLGDGSLDRMASEVKRAGKPFGFGGIGRIGEGDLPAERILGEHLRLGSSLVILSRSFHKGAGADAAFAEAIARLRETERKLAARTAAEIESDRLEARKIVASVIQRKKGG